MLWMIATALAGDCATLEDGKWMPVGVVSFTPQFELTPEGQEAVASVVCALQQNQVEHVQVEVHTDARGSADYNRATSQKRADAVRTALQEAGVLHATALGRGEDYPLDSNATEAGRVENRRVEFYADPASRPPPYQAPAPAPSEPPPPAPSAPGPRPAADPFCAEFTAAVDRSAVREWAFPDALDVVAKKVEDCLKPGWEVSRDGAALYADRAALHLRVEGDGSTVVVELSAR